jgi:hypothetical protein
VFACYSSSSSDQEEEEEEEEEEECSPANLLLFSSADQVIRENPASRGTETSAEVLVGPPGRMVSNAGPQQWYWVNAHSRRRPTRDPRPPPGDGAVPVPAK